MWHYVYILTSSVDGSFYTGMTDNLKKRLSDHNSGHVRYTSSKKPWKVVWCCAFRDKKKALEFEKYLKSGSGFAFGRKRLIEVY